MSSLAEREKQLLLQIARSALTLGVANKPPLRDFPTEVFLQQPAGAFVTLHLRGRLRRRAGRLALRACHKRGAERDRYRGLGSVRAGRRDAAGDRTGETWSGP